MPKRKLKGNQKRKPKKKKVSHTSASDSGRTLANFRWNNQNRRSTRAGGYLSESKRPGSASRQNRRRKTRRKK